MQGRVVGEDEHRFLILVVQKAGFAEASEA